MNQFLLTCSGSELISAHMHKHTQSHTEVCIQRRCGANV